MNFLLDEQLHDAVARALDAIGQLDGHAFTHVYDHRAGGTPDERFPELCRDLSVGVLVTGNVRDFGARKVHYQGLLDAGIHVVVLRWGKASPYPNVQLGMLANGYRRILVLLEEAAEPVLIRVTPSGVAEPRTLGELVAEIEGEIPS